jgi:hypothetical protein
MKAKENEEILLLRFENIDAQGDFCLSLTKEAAKMLRDFIDEVLESTK